jgi:hypothetical protein
MDSVDHLAVADRLNQLAEKLQVEGDDVAMAEMLWGAVNRMTNALALQHELAHGNSYPRGGRVIRHLIANHGNNAELQDNWLSASALHGHFYNSHLEPADLAGHVQDTQKLIAALRHLCRPGIDT